MYPYFFTSMAWKFICTVVCSTASKKNMYNHMYANVFHDFSTDKLHFQPFLKCIMHQVLQRILNSCTPDRYLRFYPGIENLILPMLSYPGCHIRAT